MCNVNQMTVMIISIERIDRACPESEIYNSLLSLDGKRILELGCGRAELTRAIATGGRDRCITALEVDEVQHAKNLQIPDLPNVRFELAGAEAIPEPDNSFDVALMFKSLHHVPVDLMGHGLTQIHRTLRPGGYAYISEPIFAGDFNEVLRLFHDEQQVRAAAFRAVKAAVKSGRFQLVKQTFFNMSMFFENFEEFEDKIIRATHSDHQLSDELHEQVKERFAQNIREDGARFIQPIRVDLLRKLGE